MRIKHILLLLTAALLFQCKNHETKSFTEQMLQGDWIPVDTAFFRKVPDNRFIALSFYNSKGGVADTTYSVRHDSIYVKNSTSHSLNGRVVASHWRYWRRILDIRHDSLFLFRHSSDTTLVLVNAALRANKSLHLNRITFIISPAESSRPPRFGTIEISKDTVFAKPFGVPEKTFYLSGTQLLGYYQDKVQKINWALTKTGPAPIPDKTDPVALLVETDSWTKDFCCYQNFRDPVFNQMMRQLDQLSSLLNLKELKHSHTFPKSNGTEVKQ
jgi:hypothetical protein